MSKHRKSVVPAIALIAAAVILWTGSFGGMHGAGGIAHAHHSFSVFDMTTEKIIRGTVVEFEWTNPHTWTWLDVTDDDGTVARWGLEGMSPNFLGRRGWSKNTFRPGDEIEAVIYPLKSGEPGGTLLRATLEDGTLVVMFGRAP
jgi:hypothetical protein